MSASIPSEPSTSSAMQEKQTEADFSIPEPLLSLSSHTSDTLSVTDSPSTNLRERVNLHEKMGQTTASPSQHIHRV